MAIPLIFVQLSYRVLRMVSYVQSRVALDITVSKLHTNVGVLENDGLVVVCTVEHKCSETST